METSSHNSTLSRPFPPRPIPYPVKVVVVFPNIAGNILCCVVIAKTKSLHNFCNFLLMNLAVSDMMAGLIELYYTTYDEISGILEFEESLTLLKIKLFVYPMIQVSILTVTVIAIERFLAITQPFKVMRKGRTKYLKFIIPLVWILGFILTLPVFITFYGKSVEDVLKVQGTKELMIDGIFSMVSAYLVPLSLMICTYFRILFVLKRRNEPFRSQQSLANVQSQANQRVLRLLGAVILSHNVCFLPYAIVQFLMTQPFGFNMMKKSNYDAYQITYFMQFLSPCLNLLIYFAHSRVFRDASKKILCRSIKVKP